MAGLCIQLHPNNGQETSILYSASGGMSLQNMVYACQSIVKALSKYYQGMDFCCGEVDSEEVGDQEPGTRNQEPGTKLF